MKIFAYFAALTLLATSAMADDGVWQKSYQLESVGKYTDALAVLDPVPANSADAELKSLRRGWLFYLLGRYDEAIREYRFAVARNERSIDAKLGLTLPLLAKKNWVDAENVAREVLKMAPNNYTALLRLTIALEGQKNWEEMGKVASVMVAGYPTDSSAYVYLARAKAWQGKVNEAVVAYLAVLSRYPGHAEAKAYLEKK